MDDIDEFALLDDDDEILLVLMELILDGENADDERREKVDVDVNGWKTLSNLSFKENFRMDRTVFERLIVAVGNHLQAHDRLVRLRTPLDVCLLMGLWPIFNPDTFRSSGAHFGVHRSVIFFHYTYIIEALRERSDRYIKWPTAAQRDNISASFERRYGYPGVVGCIDGVHIRVTAPLQQPQRYVNRHHHHSILVQAVCDNRLLYRDVYVGEVGCTGDARTYQRSPLSRNLLLRRDMLHDYEHILGDGAYTLTSKVFIGML